MNRKIAIISVCTLFLIISSMSAPLTFAQVDYWEYCKISVYAKALDDYSTSSTNTQRYRFTVATPPTGSEITNTIECMNSGTGENFTDTLEDGDIVYLNYLDLVPIENRAEQAEEPNHFIINYEGEVLDLTINNVLIPEFSPILIAPMFIAVTLLALIYRRKHKK